MPFKIKPWKLDSFISIQSLTPMKSWLQPSTSMLTMLTIWEPYLNQKLFAKLISFHSSMHQSSNKIERRAKACRWWSRVVPRERTPGNLIPGKGQIWPTSQSKGQQRHFCHAAILLSAKCFLFAFTAVTVYELQKAGISGSQLKAFLSQGFSSEPGHRKIQVTLQILPRIVHN